MRHRGSSARVLRGTFAALTFLVAARSARAHVQLDDPNGGETLDVGSHFIITWHVAIPHELLNWDLWYSTVSNGGPWITIAEDLAPGSGEINSIHTYDWTVPDAVGDTVWVRVRMDNVATDYYDVSDAPFSIVLPPETGDVGQQTRVAKMGSGVVLTWDVSCSGEDTDYAVYEGRIGQFTSHRPVVCSTGGNTEYGPFVPALGDRYFLVVPRQSTHEGSYGTDSEGNQRPTSGLACVPQGALVCP